MGAGRGPAVFLDRDGTLIEDAGYLRDPGGVHVVEGAAEALAKLRRHGFRLVVVSNQSGIARGLIRPAEAVAVHERFVESLHELGAELDDVRYCPHAPGEGCPCRKPAPGLLLEAAEALGIDLARSYAIGDKASDVEAGRRAGCRTVLLVLPGSREAVEPAEPDCVAADWADAARFVTRELAAR